PSTTSRSMTSTPGLDRLILVTRSRCRRSGRIPEHSYGVWPVKRAGVIRPAVRGVRFGEGSASAVVDVCVATHMRGLVPHDRVCEVRSGAVLWRRAWPVVGCSQCSLGSLLASLRRCALLAEPLPVG